MLEHQELKCTYAGKRLVIFLPLPGGELSLGYHTGKLVHKSGVKGMAASVPADTITSESELARSRMIASVIEMDFASALTRPK